MFVHQIKGLGEVLAGVYEAYLRANRTSTDNKQT